MPAPCKLTFDLLTLKVVSCSRLRPDVRDRQMSDRQTDKTSDTHHHLMPPPCGGGRIIIIPRTIFIVLSS